MLSVDEDRPPVPPADLMLRVVPTFDAKDVEAVRHSFDTEGLNNLRFFEHAVAAVSRWHFGGEIWLGDERVGIPRSLANFDRLLDFGCGCGRFVRHLGPLADRVEIHGTDIDAEMIEWLRSNVPFGRYEVAPHEPPLPYPDRYFDLVISHSVFTHLDERRQDQWLGELHRVTRPEALLLLTVEGQSTWARTRQATEGVGEDVERWETELETRGILFIENDGWVGSTHPEFYHSTIHAPWYVLEHWGELFDVEAYLPDGSWSQDLVVLRRRADEDPSPRPPIKRRPAPTAPAKQGQTRTVARPRLRFADAFSRLIRWGLHRIQARLGDTEGAFAPSDPDAQHLIREVGMLRLGLYEHGKRISVLAEQLRDEIKAVGNNDFRA